MLHQTTYLQNLAIDIDMPVNRQIILTMMANEPEQTRIVAEIGTK